MTNTTMKTMNIYEGYITVDVPVQYYADNEESGEELFREDCKFLERVEPRNGWNPTKRPSVRNKRWEDLELVGQEEVLVKEVA
jgi:hypothetical protein